MAPDVFFELDDALDEGAPPGQWVFRAPLTE
jgi:hypothetical protein